ncbi:MAG: hypothetical protein EZS28_056511, partial [Streblomastix strix]
MRSFISHPSTLQQRPTEQSSRCFTTGYTVKAIEDVDIAPSITYFIKSGIKKITYKNVPPEFLGLHGAGVVDSDCIPNDVVPEEYVSQCKDESPVVKHLDDYSVGRYYKVDGWDMKDLISQFGVVLDDRV